MPSGTKKTRPTAASTSYWGIPKFPTKLKNEFIGECKKRGICMRSLLANLIKGWLFDVTKKDSKDS